MTGAQSLVAHRLSVRREGFACTAVACTHAVVQVPLVPAKQKVERLHSVQQGCNAKAADWNLAQAAVSPCSMLAC